MLIANWKPPSVPVAGGRTVMCGCGPGPSEPFRVTFTMKVPLLLFLMIAAFTGPATPVESL